MNKADFPYAKESSAFIFNATEKSIRESCQELKWWKAIFPY